MGSSINAFRKMAGLLKYTLFSAAAAWILMSGSAAVFASENSAAAASAAAAAEASGLKKTEINRQKILHLSSPVYDAMDRLYTLEGMSLPSTSRPWSVSEVLKLYYSLPDAAENASASETALRKIVDEIIADETEETETGKFTFRTGKILNIETYVKANENRDEWEHGFEERNPFLSLTLESWFLESLYTTFDVTVKEEYRAITELDNNFINIPFSPRDLDWYWPFRAFGALGGEHWSLQFGRDQASWGAGRTGTLTLSDYSDFYNLIRFTAYGDKFKFTTVYIGLDPWLTGEEKEIDELAADIDNGLAGRYENYQELFKAFFAKRLEYRATDKLTLSLTDAIIFGNKYIGVTDLNPIFFLHNLFNPEYSNVMMDIEANYTPVKGLNLYLQLALDELQVPGYEGEDSRPGAGAVLGGFSLAKPSGEGLFLLYGEAALTQPYLYNRWHPLTRFTNRRRMWSNIEPDRYEYINKPIGYQHGPDSVILYAGTGYEKPGIFSTEIDAQYRLKGEMNSSLDDPQSYDTGIAPSNLSVLSGTVEKELVTGLHATILPKKNLRFGTNLYWINTHNYNNSSGRTMNDFEWIFSAGMTF